MEADKAEKENDSNDNTNTNDKPLAHNHEEIDGTDVENTKMSEIFMMRPIQVILFWVKLMGLMWAIRPMMSKQIQLWKVVLKTMMN